MADLWNNLRNVFGTVLPQDLLDIAIISYLFYQVAKLVRETRAAQLVKGIMILLLMSVLATQLRLRTLSFLMENILQTGLVVMVVVFQPELRRALEQVGRSQIGKLKFFSSGMDEGEVRERWRGFVDALVEGAASLSRQKIGALVVIERNTRLGDIIKTGTVIDSGPSAELIGNIFFPNSPLHDGAMVVRDGRLHAAGCFLPLSDNSEISRELGTRHRAALGMSEMSDAVVVVVLSAAIRLNGCASTSPTSCSRNRVNLPRKNLSGGRRKKHEEVGFWADFPKPPPVDDLFARDGRSFVDVCRHFCRQ